MSQSKILHKIATSFNSRLMIFTCFRVFQSYLNFHADTRTVDSVFQLLIKQTYDISMSSFEAAVQHQSISAHYLFQSTEFSCTIQYYTMGRM